MWTRLPVATLSPRIHAPWLCAKGRRSPSCVCSSSRAIPWTRTSRQSPFLEGSLAAWGRRGQGGPTVAAITQQVEIECWPLRRILPCGEQDRPLQDKPVRVTRDGESVKPSFDGEADEGVLEVFASWPGEGKEG